MRDVPDRQAENARVCTYVSFPLFARVQTPTDSSDNASTSKRVSEHVWNERKGEKKIN